jgi:hypothetical protein
VGEERDDPDFLAAALSETVPLEWVFFVACVFPPLVSLVDWGMGSFRVMAPGHPASFEIRGPGMPVL